MPLRLGAHQLARGLPLTDHRPRGAGRGDELKAAGGDGRVQQRGVPGDDLESAFREQTQHIGRRTGCESKRDLSEGAESPPMRIEPTAQNTWHWGAFFRSVWRNVR